MLKPYDLLESVLGDIENGLKEGINDANLAKKNNISAVHLSRLFKFAFGQTIGGYIRSRKMAASIEDLLLSDLNVLDIAMEYGIDYEQSYIRAFKREYGITPGELRKSGKILKIMPPLQLFDYNRLVDGLVFGPEIVIIPQFHVVGKKYKMPFRDVLGLANHYRGQFDKERMRIPNTTDSNVTININSGDENDVDYSWFMPSVQVNSFDNIPKGFDRYTFPTSLCARFRYISIIGDDVNMAVADKMFDAIDDFMADEHQNYFLERKRINIDKFSSSSYDGCLCEWEWFAPVIKKTIHDTPKNPDGIIKTYRQEVPAVRFIGKKYNEPPDDSVFDKILARLDNWRLNYMFDAIEKNSGRELKKLYDGSDAYICLMRKKDDGSLEYWLGMFTPANTEVPAGYEMIDFPKLNLGVCRVYGKRNRIIHYDTDCRNKLTHDAICKPKDTADSPWFFQRFNWHRFFEEDRYGKRLLDYCYFLL